MNDRSAHDAKLQQPATLGDVLQLRKVQEQTQELLQSLREELRAKKFYTVEEFSREVGPSKAVIQKYCVIGKLKATQVVKGGTWIIDASEIERMRKEAKENHFNKAKSTNSTDKAILKKLGITNVKK